MTAYRNLVCALFCVVVGFNLMGCSIAPPPPINQIPFPVDEVESILHTGTMAGIERALANNPGTFILRCRDFPSHFIVSWRSGGGWSFVLLDADVQTAKAWQDVAGQVTTPKTFSEFVKDAKALKFQWVSGEDAALALYQGVALAKSWITEIAASELMPLFTLTGGETIPYDFLPPAGRKE